MAVRSIAGVSPVTNSMVSTTPVDASNYTTERVGDTNAVRQAQPFFASQPFLSRVTFRRGVNTGTFVGTVKVSIQAGTTNAPSGTDLVAYTYTNAQWNALTTDTDVTVTLRTPLTVGGLYFIVWTSSTSDGSNYTRIFAHRATANLNAAGAQIRFDGASWAVAGGGAKYFKITSGPAYYIELARTLISTPRTTTTSRVAVRDMGTALRFGATNTDRVFVENSAGGVTSNITDATYSMWVRPRTMQGATNYIFSLPATTGNNRRYIQMTATNFIATNFGSTGFTTTKQVVPGETVHIAATVTTGGNYIIYVNGASIRNSTFTMGTGTEDFFIGNLNNAGTNAFIGTIDEFRIHSRALSAQEVANMYFLNVVPRTGLVAEYLFNEASGTTALDTSGNGNNGTITGATYTTDVPLLERTAI